jgi:hypothetical protein
MIYIRYRYRIAGSHVHVRVFSCNDKEHWAKCGDLCFRKEEWLEIVKGNTLEEYLPEEDDE